MITDRGETLDKEIKTTKLQRLDDEVSLTVYSLLTECEDIKSAKEDTVEKAKELYDNAMNGAMPTRADQFPSYLAPQLVNMFVTLIKTPDVRIRQTGLSEELELLMSKYLEDVVWNGGFVDLLERGWGGYHQTALYGDFFVLASTEVLNGKKEQKKIKNGEKFVNYQGLSVGNAFFNRMATAIRSNSISQQVTRCMFTTDMNIYEAEEIFEGITDIALPGNIPGTDQEDNRTDLTSQEQLALDENKNIQIGFFFDSINKVYSIRAGANNAEYARIDGAEFDKYFSIWWRGKEQPMLPISHLQMYPRTEGIYSSGLVEMFLRICVNEGLLNNYMVNNLFDINNSPMWLNVDGARAGDILKQLRLGKRAMERGERAVLFPNGTSRDSSVISANDVQYLRPEPATDDNERQFARFDSVIKRMGWNLDYNFTDPNKTLGQTELDIQSVNRTVSSFWKRNTDFIEFNYSFAIDRIIKLGDENDETVFGRDVEVDINGENVKLSKIVGKDFTVGFIVKLFKYCKDSMRLDIDTQSGTAFNDLLERSNLEKRLQVAMPGSPEYLRIASALSVLSGSKPLSAKDVQGQGEAPDIQNAKLTPNMNANV